MWLDSVELFNDWIGDDLPPVTDETVERWISKAERLLRREFPTLQDRIDTDDTGDLLDNVKDVISAMVTRVLRNPDGRRSTQKGAGPFTESITFGGDTPGVLFLTSEERAVLADVSDAGHGRAFTISMGGTYASAHLPWCSGLMGGVSCSCGALIAGEPIFERG